MTVDITLRALSGPGSPALVRMLSGAGLIASLPTEFPDARERRVDTLVQLDDGRILHIEWQTGFDATMPQRMLGYWLLISAAYPEQPVDQLVIQVGGHRIVPGVLKTHALSFRYRVIDSRDHDPGPLLASPALADNILAVLFGTPAELPGRIRVILRRLEVLEPRARRDALTQLLILAGFRRVTWLIHEEAKAMPLILDIEADPYLAGLVNRGRNQGESLALIRVAERRFGPLPDAVRERIRAADLDTIEAWLDRVVDAPSLDALFAPPPVN